MHRDIRGFSLIELMMVIAILGTLLAIALPAYQDYSIRTKNAECLSVAAGAKAAVGEGLHRVGGSEVGENYRWGESTNYCESVEIDENGVITATTQATGGDPLAVFELEPYPTASRTAWTCAETSGAPRSQVPSSCR